MEMNPQQRPDDFKGPRPEEEISFDVTVCAPEFPEGCIESTDEQVNRAENRERLGE
jgi:hypothetical protein